MGGGELLGVVEGLHACADTGEVDSDGLDMNVLPLADELCRLLMAYSFDISEIEGKR